MVTQFVPAPVHWELRVEVVHDVPVLRRTERYPVVGWEYTPGDYDVPPGADPDPAEITPWVSYRGEVVTDADALEQLQQEVTDAARRIGTQTSGTIKFELVPA